MFCKSGTFCFAAYTGSKKYCINSNLVSLNSAAYKGSTLLLSMGPRL